MAFLNVVPLEEALRIVDGFRERLARREKEVVKLEEALGRVLAEDVVSPMDVPPFDRATVDGYAVRSRDTFMAGDGNPVELRVIGEVNAGETYGGELGEGTCVYISTGAPLPAGADAVIQFEDVEREGDVVRIYRPAYPGLGVMKRGSDLAKGELILRKGKRLTFKDTALLSAVGMSEVSVLRKLRVAVVSTGNEVILPGEKLSEGRIYDVNGRAVSDAVRSAGEEAVFLGVVRDSLKEIEEAIRRGAECCDVVILSGGASGGTRDLTAKAVSKLGRVLVHGIAIQPGKPTIIGEVNGKPVFGLPGYPTSCLTNFTLLVMPLLSGDIRRERARKRLAHKVFSVKGRRQFLPVRIDGDKAIPILKGSGAVTSFVSADGFIEIPENVEILDEGEEVEVTLFGA
ncbi:MAG: molybdopterin molybdenumtransferase MoeA [Thermococci archaeon]|nr:molybdopterin molybdenumtransferase MoeA [Thermococci archaeon]